MQKPIDMCGGNGTNKEVISYIRATAKTVGLTFKRDGESLDGQLLYAFYKRGTAEIALDRQHLNLAFHDCLSGFIESWNGRVFEGVHYEGL